MGQGFSLGKLEQQGRSPFLAIVLAVTFFPTPPAPAQTISQRGMVTAAQPAAAKVGIAILKAGGNAVDAAVATAFMISVEPTIPSAWIGLKGGSSGDIGLSKPVLGAMPA